jgi:hypothetical protein
MMHRMSILTHPTYLCCSRSRSCFSLRIFETRNIETELRHKNEFEKKAKKKRSGEQLVKTRPKSEFEFHESQSLNPESQFRIPNRKKKKKHTCSGEHVR